MPYSNDAYSTGGWARLERPGYFGSRRDELCAGYDQRFRAGRWRLAWAYGELSLTRAEMCMIYEDAYLAFMAGRPDVVDQLCAEAADVYDDAPSNCASGLDYTAQETGRTHVQDIAIRRCLVRLGRAFSGERLVQIRDSLGEHPLSMTLSPGQVPFHRPELLETPELDGWWAPGSVESFYQSNKWLEVAYHN